MSGTRRRNVVIRSPAGRRGTEAVEDIIEIIRSYLK